MSTRWIPKKGETVYLIGNRDFPKWTGVVKKVSKLGCKPGEVRLCLKDLGWTTARRDEISILKEAGNA